MTVYTGACWRLHSTVMLCLKKSPMVLVKCSIWHFQFMELFVSLLWYIFLTYDNCCWWMIYWSNFSLFESVSKWYTTVFFLCLFSLCGPICCSAICWYLKMLSSLGKLLQFLLHRQCPVNTLQCASHMLKVQENFGFTWVATNMTSIH